MTANTIVIVSSDHGFFLGERSATTRRTGVDESPTIGGLSATATIDQLDNLSFPRSRTFVSVS